MDIIFIFISKVKKITQQEWKRSSIIVATVERLGSLTFLYNDTPVRVLKFYWIIELFSSFPALPLLFTLLLRLLIEIHQQRYLETRRALNRFNNPLPPVNHFSFTMYPNLLVSVTGKFNIFHTNIFMNNLKKKINIDLIIDLIQSFLSSFLFYPFVEQIIRDHNWKISISMKSMLVKCSYFYL